MSEDYVAFVNSVEEGLSPAAKKSFEGFSPSFLDGGEYAQHYIEQWDEPQARTRIENRTPLQYERDRILYSDGMRKLTEKYHVLYRGGRRIIRNFTTHTMRMAQVARAISNGLSLNPDFAEALALGAKVGAPPFVHASKTEAAEWIIRKLRALDDESLKDGGASSPPLQERLFRIKDGTATVPHWISAIRSKKVARAVKVYMPWAAGEDIMAPFNSGSQGYWSLAVDPYLITSKSKRFAPETMFGIWRHSLGDELGKGSFEHRYEIEGASSGEHVITWEHATYEALVVRYADDITWVIENLEDANRVSIIGDDENIFLGLLADLRHEIGGVAVNVNPLLNDALLSGDSGGLYNYFISEFVRFSRNKMNGLREGLHARQALREGHGGALIGLPPQASETLTKMKDFLRKKVFEEPRVRNRREVLRVITRACLDLLYGDRREALEAYVKKQTKMRSFRDEDRERALSHLSEPVHRVQLAVHVFSQMSDQEIYDFVGIQGL